MYNAMFNKNRIGVGGGIFDRFHTTALVDSHINNHASRLHFFHHIFGNDFRRPCPWNKDCTDNQVRMPGGFGQVVAVGIKRFDSAHKDIFQVTQPVYVNINYRDSGSKPHSPSDGSHPYRAAADHYHRPRGDARHAFQQDPFAATGFFQIDCPFLDCHAPGHFTHGG